MLRTLVNPILSLRAAVMFLFKALRCSYLLFKAMLKVFLSFVPVWKYRVRPFLRGSFPLRAFVKACQRVCLRASLFKGFCESFCKAS